MTWEAERQVAVDAVRQASWLCRAAQHDLKRSTLRKDDRSLVTVADFAGQAVVARALLGAFPDDPLVGEEDAEALRRPEHAALRAEVHARVRTSVDATEDEVLRWIDHGRGTPSRSRSWILDPIDGTSGFLQGEHYAVALALLVEGRLELAALGCPTLPLGAEPDDPVGVTFIAVRGQGVSAVPLFASAAPRVVRVSTRTELSTLRRCESVDPRYGDHEAAAEVSRRLGLKAPPVRLEGQAKYGMVARGDVELYLRLPRSNPDHREKVWDHAPGALVVEEAGGVVTDVDGRALDFGHGETLAPSRGIVASHGRHHARVLGQLQAMGI